MSDSVKQESILYVENLHIAYPNITIVDNECFYVKPGETVVILGDNGAGKSSLINSIILAPNIRQFVSRDLYFDGKKIADKDLNDFRRSIGYAMQEDDEDPLFSRKVKSYVLDYASDALQNNGFREYYDKLFNEYLACNAYADGKLNDRRLKDCSGGEKRMVSILRAFSRHHSKLFILDEPINNLDAKHARILNNFLIDLKKQPNPPAVLIVTHCHMFRGVDRAYQLKGGRLVQIDNYEPKSCFGECDLAGYYTEDKV